MIYHILMMEGSQIVTYDINDVFEANNRYWQCRVEDFVSIRNGHSERVNQHFANLLKTFDEEYQKVGGDLGSIDHYIDRMNFARVTAKGIADDIAYSGDSQIGWFDTTTNLDCPSIGKEIEVRSITTWDGRNPELLKIKNDFTKDFIPN